MPRRITGSPASSTIRVPSTRSQSCAEALPAMPINRAAAQAARPKALIVASRTFL